MAMEVMFMTWTETITSILWVVCFLISLAIAILMSMQLLGNNYRGGYLSVWRLLWNMIWRKDRTIIYRQRRWFGSARMALTLPRRRSDLPDISQAGMTFWWVDIMVGMTGAWLSPTAT